MIQTWSRESTETPIVQPRIQWFGSGFGHNGSTSKRGATPAAPHCAAGAAAGAGAAAADGAVVDAGGAALSQATSSAPIEETSRSPARRVMVPPIRQRCPLDQGLFLARIIAEIGASSRAGAGLYTKCGAFIC